MASGFPDYYSSLVIHGEYAGAYKAIGCDSQGNLIALLKGLYAGDPSPVALDVDGNIKVNISAQGLANVFSAPWFGTYDPEVTTGLSVYPNSELEILSATKKCTCAGIFFSASGTNILLGDSLRVVVDGESLFSSTFQSMLDRGGGPGLPAWFTLSFLGVNSKSVGASCALIFPVLSTVRVYYTESTGGQVSVSCTLHTFFL